MGGCLTPVGGRLTLVSGGLPPLRVVDWWVPASHYGVRHAAVRGGHPPLDWWNFYLRVMTVTMVNSLP